MCFLRKGKLERGRGGEGSVGRREGGANSSEMIEEKQIGHVS